MDSTRPIHRASIPRCSSPVEFGTRPDYPSRRVPPFSHLRLVVLLLATLPACGEVDAGVVELAWEFVDRNGDKIYPGGLFDPGKTDACDLPGRIDGQPVTYDLGLLVEICDTTCAQGCGDPDCLVQPPLRFSCKEHRGSDPSVPSSDEPYRFTVRPVVEIDQGDRVCLEALPTCIAVPGPRERIVEPGLVTDLQVFQVAVDIERGTGDPLDLEACGCV